MLVGDMLVICTTRVDWGALHKGCARSQRYLTARPGMG